GWSASSVCYWPWVYCCWHSISLLVQTAFCVREPHCGSSSPSNCAIPSRTDSSDLTYRSQILLCGRQGGSKTTRAAYRPIPPLQWGFFVYQGFTSKCQFSKEQMISR